MNYRNYAKRIFRLVSSQERYPFYYGEFEDFRKKNPQFVLDSFIYYVGCIYREFQESFGDLAEDVMKLFDEPYMSNVMYDMSSGYNISEIIDQIFELGNDNDVSNIYKMFAGARISDMQYQFDRTMAYISDGLIKFFKELIQSNTEDFVAFADYLKRGGHARIAAYLWSERDKNKDPHAYEERKLQEFRKKLKRDVEEYINKSVYYDKSIVSCIQGYYFEGDATVREAFKLYAKDIAAIDVEAPISLKISELNNSQLSYLIRSMIQVGDNALRMLSERGLESLKSTMYSAWSDKSEYAQIARDAYESSPLAAGFVEFFDGIVKEMIAEFLSFDPGNV